MYATIVTNIGCTHTYWFKCLIIRLDLEHKNIDNMECTRLYRHTALVYQKPHMHRRNFNHIIITIRYTGLYHNLAQFACKYQQHIVTIHTFVIF